MSLGSAGRCIGKWDVRFSSSSGDITARSQRVSTGPGQTALTRISGPSARASDFVIVLSAPLLAAYAIDEPSPPSPATELTLTTAPPPDVRIRGAAARMQKNGPLRFTCR